MPAWPATLPQAVELAGLQITMPETRIGSTPDTGPQITRQRSTAAPEPFIGFITVTTAQLATFRTFYQTTLAGGTAPFDWTHPETGDPVSLRFQLGATPTKVSIGKAWRIQLPLEVMP